MLRCIQLAKNGLGTTYPNPLVGSVIVYENKIIGEGWHEQSGMPHAEVNAITSVKNQSLLKNATIYVSLEPCSHFGKTPPCANLIIEKGIKNVIIGSMDPNPKVAGNGIKLLKDNGCNVVEGILEKECNDLNKRFFTFFKKQRPYIILKWAETSDGFISPKNKTEKSPVWITNKKSRQIVHKWRAEEASILIGTNTAIEDNPSLTTRDWDGNSPIRLVIDKNLKIPLEANVFDNSAKTIVITELRKENREQLIYETIDFSKNIAQQICEIIYRYKIQSLIVEGGAKTLQTFIDENLWDEARIFKGIPLFKEGTKAPLLNGNLVSETKIKQDSLKIILND
ncbi:MAG: diaminohydroxyphosphoribosylaminopyrimidine deaminase [bacterium]|jgi:diaminohydroxyphosphoribosylaminopyrimidine deaminase/5-amino-6-(5-phosphoribosylamino)uracil reductase